MTIVNLSNRVNKILPVSFRVIGFGKRSQYIINQITSKNYPGVEAFVYDNSNIIPVDEDQMILLINPLNKDILSIAKTFFQAGVLTLIISSRDLSKMKDCFDAFTKLPQSKILPTIKGILDPLFHFGPISFDFNDIKLTLKDSGRFIVNTCKSETLENRLVKLSDEIFQELKALNFENLSFILSYNNESRNPLQASELEKFQDFLKSLPENVNIIWGVQNDEKLEKDQIKVTTLISGSNLKF